MSGPTTDQRSREPKANESTEERSSSGGKEEVFGPDFASEPKASAAKGGFLDPPIRDVLIDVSVVVVGIRDCPESIDDIAGRRPVEMSVEYQSAVVVERTVVVVFGEHDPPVAFGVLADGRVVRVRREFLAHCGDRQPLRPSERLDVSFADIMVAEEFHYCSFDAAVSGPSGARLSSRARRRFAAFRVRITSIASGWSS